MSSTKFTFDGETNITHNGRTVELKLYATSWWYHSKETRYEPEENETEIDEIEISDAHYTDNNEPVSADELYDDVRKDMENNWDYYFSNEEEYEDCSEMDCVDRWNVAHGIEV